MWKIHRYYLKEVSISSILTFSVLFGVVLISVVYRGIDRAQGFGIWAIAKTTLFMAADTIPHLLSISLLFATVLCFARASQDKEITAIRSAGISPRVALSSAMMVGIVFSLASSYAFHYVIPWAHFYKYRVVANELRAVILTTGLGDDNIKLQGRISMTWEKDLGQGRFEDVYINVLKDDAEGAGGGVLGQQGIYRAKMASLLADLENENLTLRIEDLYDPVSGAQLGELSLSVNLRAIVEGGGRRRESERDMTSVQLLSEVNLGIHSSPGGAEYTVHRRGCFALMPFLFAPLGFCIGVLARDRGRVFALVLSMAPLMLFYLSDLLGAEILQRIDLPILGWLPAMVVFLLGLPFCWRLLRF